MTGKADRHDLRNSHTLTFHNYDADVSGQGGSLAYETPLADYYFEPEYPENLEAGACRFAGWYTTPQRFDGSEVDFSAATMPDADLLLYAKWVRLRATPSASSETAAMTQEELLGQQTVPHGGYAQAPEDFENGGYVFSGWFYLDGGVKKAFDFANMPVTRGSGHLRRVELSGATCSECHPAMSWPTAPRWRSLPWAPPWPVRPKPSRPRQAPSFSMPTGRAISPRPAAIPF